MPHPDLAELAESWLVHLRAERKSPSTLRIYRAGVKAYLAWCADNGQPAILDRNLLAAFTADLLDQGAEPATAQARHLAVRRFARWLHAEGELAEDPLAGMRPPKLDSKVIPVLSDDELRRLVKACEGWRPRNPPCLPAGEGGQLTVHEPGIIPAGGHVGAEHPGWAAR
jgi:integrase/recombinase XerD